MTHLFTGVPSGGADLPGAFERVAWYEGAYFLNEYVSWLLGLPIIILGFWGIAALIRRIWRHRKQLPGLASGSRSPAAAIALILVVTVEALFLVFGFGFVAASNRQLGRGEGIAFGLGGVDLMLLRLAWVIALAAIPVVILCATAWRRRWWTGFGRICYTILALDSIAIAHFLLWFGYVPGRW